MPSREFSEGHQLTLGLMGKTESADSMRGLQSLSEIG